ncbi:MAG TPA: histidine kinase, partial [Chitinophagaceae bacterium]|nr:histidine kinase [Chitinophagaceae bacterium]
MIKDFVFKLLFIPLIGILIPILSGLITYSNYSTPQLIFSNLFFILSWFIIWQGNVFIIAHLRNRKYLSNIFLQLTTLCSLTAIVTGMVAFFSAAMWQQTYLPYFQMQKAINYTLLSAVASIFITLMYEVLFLKKEVELDTKIVDQLDQERQHAEMNVLKNELDPHFIFNSLTALAHLVNDNTDKAKLFIQKLAQAYKYLLMNKDREIISLNEEL